MYPKSNLQARSHRKPPPKILFLSSDPTKPSRPSWAKITITDVLICNTNRAQILGCQKPASLVKPRSTLIPQSPNPRNLKLNPSSPKCLKPWKTSCALLHFIDEALHGRWPAVWDPGPTKLQGTISIVRFIADRNELAGFATQASWYASICTSRVQLHGSRNPPTHRRAACFQRVRGLFASLLPSCEHEDHLVLL